MPSSDINQLNKNYSYRVENHRLLSRKEEIEYLTNAIKHGCNVSRNALIKHNRKFVVSVAYTIHNKFPTVSVDDLIGAGMVGLCMAIEKFDPNQIGKIKLTSQSVWWIQQSIYKHIHEYEATIRIPMNKICDIRKELKSDRYSKTRELPYEHSVYLSNSLAMPSIDDSLGDNKDITLVDMVSYKNYDGTTHIENTIHEGNVKHLMGMVIDKLPPRQKQVVSLLYGLLNDQPMSMREVGAEVGLSHERVRNIRNNAFKILHTEFKKLGIQ